MASNERHGERLLASLIDSHATNDPGRAWASVPQDENDLSKGFVDLTYEQFANAINHASWWLENNLDKAMAPFETIAYAGPKDLRYPILAVAAVKIGKKLLLPSPFTTPQAQTHLLHATGCHVYLHSACLAPLVSRVLQDHPETRAIQVPGISEWLKAEKAPIFPYHKTWDEGKLDPWLIFHTSGTTGLPKPITYTNQMMTSLDAAEVMPSADQETINDHFRNDRWYTPLPSLHFVGMLVTLQMTVFLNTVVVLVPPSATTAMNIDQILEFGNIAGVILPPSILTDLCRDPGSLDRLRKLQYVYFAGGPLPQATAEMLLGHVKLQPAMGSTEAGAYFLEVRDDRDWEYYSPRPEMGVEFVKRGNELYELVFIRQPGLERWQQLFQVYPLLDHFPTKDLWTRHPSESNLWRYAGRADDMIVFSHGEEIHASTMEAVIEKHPAIEAALIGGEGRHRPCLIVELVRGTDISSEEAILDTIWPVIDQANEPCLDYVKLTRKLVLISSPAKRFVRTIKGTISRRESLALYSEEIEKLYQTHEM